MTNDEKNPHTERFPFGNVVYWKDNTACGKLDKWTRADVEAFGQFPQIHCYKPQEVTELVMLMREAYKAGRRDKAEEIRKVFHTP